MTTYPATPGSATRVVLREISTRMKTPELTSLLRLDCVALRYEMSAPGMVLTFVMRDFASEDRLKVLLAKLFDRIKKLYAVEADTALFNIDTATP